MVELHLFLILIFSPRSRSKDEKFVTVSQLSRKDFDVSQVYRTVNPALAFQYVSDNPPDLSVRVPAYYNNLNSWLGQTMQRDCGQVRRRLLFCVCRMPVPSAFSPFYRSKFRWRLWTWRRPATCCACARSRASPSRAPPSPKTTWWPSSRSVRKVNPVGDDRRRFLSILENTKRFFLTFQSIESQTSILNATVLQREKFIQLIGREIRLEHVDIAHWAGLGGVRWDI